jgi:hypothetical protein
MLPGMAHCTGFLRISYEEEAMSSKKPAKPKLKIKTKVKAGGGHNGVQLNHNEDVR